MSSNYSGNATATQSPSPAPGPGAVPIVVLPSDGDALAAASVAQGYKTVADYLSYLYTNVASANRGWTPPSSSVDTAQASFQDSAGHVRGTVDHNGYPGGGRISVIDECWNASVSASASQSPLTNNPRWQAWTTTSTTFNTVAASAAYPSPYIQVSTTATLNSRGSILSAIQLIHSSATMLSFATEADIGTLLVGDSYWGLSSNVDFTVNQHFVRFRQSQGTANWQAECRDAVTTTTVDTGVAVTSNGDPTAFRMRIELHGSASPYGAKARFFINGTRVAEITTHLPAATLYLAFEANNTNTAAQTLSVGGVHTVWNRYLAPDNL